MAANQWVCKITDRND